MNSIFPNKIVSAIIILLILLNIFSWAAYISRGNQAVHEAQVVAAYNRGKSIMTFQKLFVTDVLGSNGTVDYATRTELEQMVGATNDQAVIVAWDAFLAAKTESDGQTAVKNLLLVMATEASQ